MEDEIEYYDSLNRPEVEEPLKVPCEKTESGYRN